MIKFFKNKKNEKGIALLFTLGILSLLLVLALGFATNSIIEQKVASNINTSVQAGLLAKTAINRAIAGMSAADATSLEFDNVRSHDVDSQHNDYLERLTTKLDGVTVYQFDRTNYDANSDEAIHWQFAYNADSEIIGRYAYIVLGDKGGLDPSATVDSGVNGIPVAENSAAKERPGVEVNEIYIAGLNPNMGTPDIDATDLAKLSSDAVIPLGTGKLAAGTRWLDFETMFSELGITGNTSKENFLRDNFILKNPPDAEAYWIDANSDDKKEESEMYHRFNLARPQADWNAMTVDQLLCETGHEAQKFSETETAKIDAAGIPYLRQIANAEETFANIETRRRQIAANLIDYSDTDNVPTSDVTPANWDASAITYHGGGADNRPIYTGNERTLYINRVATSGYLTFVGSDDGGTPTPLYTTTVTATGKIGVELVDVYGNIVGFETLSGNYEVKVYGKLTITLTHDATGDTTKTEDFTATINTFGVLSPDGYTFKWDDSGAILSGQIISLEKLGTRPTITSASATIEVTSAVLFLDGNVVDFAKFKDATSVPALGVETCSNFYSGQPGNGSTNTQSTDVFLMYTQAVDPRQNLNPGDWTKGNSKLATLPTGTDMGLTPSRSVRTSGDTEPDALNTNNGVGADNGTPRLSTAFIRNAPMKSPWEIGAIHRGAKWETINLKYYANPHNQYSVSADITANGIAYAPSVVPVPLYDTDGGDAAILDQIKMTGRKEVYGKVDINKENPNVFRALFFKIYCDGDYSNPGAQTGTEITHGDANNLATTFLGTYRMDGTKAYEFKTRAQIASMQGLYGFGTDDATQEASIGKFINLTKAGTASTEYTILAIGQSILDAGGPSPGITLIKLDDDGNQVTINNVLKGSYQQYADEITGEQKIMVVLSYDAAAPAGERFKIVRYRQIED